MTRKVGAAWILIAVLCVSIFSVPWLQLTGSTEFTSGKPERSELIVEIKVDSKMETQDIRIEQATPFVLWMMVRDSVENSTEQSQQGAANEDQNEQENEETILDLIRTIINVTVSLFGFIAILSVLQGRIRMRWVISLWAFCLLLFICLPLAWMGDMGQTLDSGLPEEQGPDEQEAFVHVNSETHFEVVYIGVEFHFEGDGWDLGMIDEEERGAAIAEPPEDENGTHDAHIGWDGEISLRYGKALTIWLTVGVLLLAVLFHERNLNREKTLLDE